MTFKEAIEKNIGTCGSWGDVYVDEQSLDAAAAECERVCFDFVEWLGKEGYEINDDNSWSTPFMSLGTTFTTKELLTKYQNNF